MAVTKKIIRIVVAVVTSFCILACTTISAFAFSDEEVLMDSEGFEYIKDDDGEIYYIYPIPLHVSPVDTHSVQLFSVLPGTEIEYTIEYTIQDIIGAGSGSLVGTVASIGAVSTGTIVLFSILAGCGLMYLCEPEYCETALNDVWYHLSGEYQEVLESQYNNPVYKIDSDILGEINNALRKSVFTSEGVTWRKALVIGTDDLTGYADVWVDDFSVVISDTLSALEANPDILFKELPQDGTWISLDDNGSISYRYETIGTWGTKSTGLFQHTSTSYAAPSITMRNNITGARLTWYMVDKGGTSNYDDVKTSYKKYIMQPIFVSDGVSSGISIPVARSDNTSYLTFVHNNTINSNDIGSFAFTRLMIDGTGTELDGKLCEVTWDETEKLWKYRYWTPYSSSVPDFGHKHSNVCYLPMEPFSWVMSQSTPSDTLAKVPFKEQTVDEQGKIVSDVPQLDEDFIGVEIQAPDKNVTVNTETGIKTETSDFTNINTGSGSGSGSGLGLNTEINPDEPDTEVFKDFITSVFNFSGLFDWLPVKITGAFDSAVSLVGSIVLTLFIFKVITAFF